MRKRKEGKRNRGQKGSMTLTLRQMRLESLEGARFCGHTAHLVLEMCVYEKERER